MPGQTGVRGLYSGKVWRPGFKSLRVGAYGLIGRSARPTPGPSRNLRGLAMSIENLPGEEWRPVVGYEEFYEVSNMGRLRTLPRKCWNGAVFWTQEPMVLRQYSSKQSGYLWVTLNTGKAPKNHFMHRLVLSAFTPNPDPKTLVVINHKDGCKTNNVLENLEWTTHKGNIRHAFATGLHDAAKERARLKGRPVEAVYRDGRVEWFRSFAYAHAAGHKRIGNIHPPGYIPKRWIGQSTLRYAGPTP